MAHDLARAGRILLRTHPAIGHVISPEAFQGATARALANLPESATRAEFVVLLDALLDTLECGHVGVDPRGIRRSARWGVVKDEVSFPLGLARLSDGRIVISSKAPTLDSSVLGQEVLSVDGENILLLAEEAASLAGGSDGGNSTGALDRALGALRQYLAWRDGPRDQFSLGLKVHPDSNEYQRIVSAWTSKDLERYRDSLSQRYKEGLSPKPIGAAHKALGYGFDSTRRVAVIDVNSFSGYDPLNLRWPRVAKRVLAKAARDGATGIVIDLRGNGGGRSANVHHLLANFVQGPTPLYRPWLTRRSGWWHASLINKLALLPSLLLHRGSEVKFGSLMAHKVDPRKKAFSGRLVAIIDSRTFSAATITASVLASSQRAIVVGEPSGGNYHQTYAGLMSKRKLRQTGINLRVPHLLIAADVNLERQPLGLTLQPDLFIPKTAEAFLPKSDPVLVAAIELAAGKSSE